MVVGFVILRLDDYIGEEKDWPVYFLWNFMIGTENQGKGYGKQTLDHLVQKCKEKAESIYMSPVHALIKRLIRCISTMVSLILNLWMMGKVC